MPFGGKTVVYVFSDCILRLLYRYKAFKTTVMFLISIASFHQCDIAVRMPFLQVPWLPTLLTLSIIAKNPANSPWEGSICCFITRPPCSLPTILKTSWWFPCEIKSICRSAFCQSVPNCPSSRIPWVWEGKPVLPATSLPRS